MFSISYRSVSLSILKISKDIHVHRNSGSYHLSRPKLLRCVLSEGFVSKATASCSCSFHPVKFLSQVPVIWQPRSANRYHNRVKAQRGYHHYCCCPLVNFMPLDSKTLRSPQRFRTVVVANVTKRTSTNVPLTADPTGNGARIHEATDPSIAFGRPCPLRSFTRTVRSGGIRLQTEPSLCDLCSAMGMDEIASTDNEAVKNKGDQLDSSLIRFTLRDVGSGTSGDTYHAPSRATESTTLSAAAGDFPTISPRFAQKAYRFVYMAGALRKIDVTTGGMRTFAVPGYMLGEPLFVPNPDGSAEDDGCVIVVALNTVAPKSVVLVLDAKEFVEVSRAELPVAMPTGFHGCLRQACA